MTTSTEQAVPGTRSRHLLVLVSLLGPAAMAGWALALPYQLSDEPAAWIPKLVADPGRAQLAMWMLLLFALTAAAGAVVVGLVARRASRRLGTAGMILTLAGFGALSFSGAGYDAAAAATVRAGLDVPTAERVLAQLGTFQAPTVGTALFVPAMFLGVALLAVALWRGRAIPRWACVLLLAAIPVVLVGGYVATAVNALGWLLIALGFGLAARSI
ncbi:hypothetical protein [Nonomuraea ceibae]|uniref:hypothetical protein n=1 Tax=Nonomuraea ceibae TaxID=1935170 RepID=UPI001C5FF07D|nr:hypothetical protein [Nonomuraea ceibae]